MPVPLYLSRLEVAYRSALTTVDVASPGELPASLVKLATLRGAVLSRRIGLPLQRNVADAIASTLDTLERIYGYTVGEEVRLREASEAKARILHVLMGKSGFD